MKKAPFFFGLALLAAVFLQLHAQDWKNFPVSKKEVTKNILLFKTGVTAAYPNMVAVKTSRGVVVIDALQYPQVAKRIREMISQEFGAPIACLINTHGAFDHTAGNEVFEDVPIYGHKDVKTQIELSMAMGKTPQLKKSMEAVLNQVGQMKSHYPGDPREIEETMESLGNILASYQNGTIKAVIPGTLFDDRYLLKMGHTTFEMFHNTPSYSSSDIIIAIPEEKALIVGDIFNKNRLPQINPQTNLESWERLFSDHLAEGSDTKYFIGTHGDVMTIDEVREQFKYLRKLLEEVQRIKSEGKSLDEAKKELSLEIFPYLNEINPYFFGTSNHTHNRNIEAIWRQSNLSPAEARKIIGDGNREWGRARVARDKPAVGNFLAPDFYAQLPDRRITRQEFIDGISVDWPGSKLTRFDATVLTVQPTADGWVAIVHEKMEIEQADGKMYSLWITRDGWKKVNNRWMIAYSEAVASENWMGGAKPPFLDW